MKKNLKNPKGSLPDEKAKSYEIRFSEDVVVQLLNIYSGDVEKTPLDLQKFGSPRDFGISLIGKFGSEG